VTRLKPSHVCAVVLAGGMGSRMGGVDKGLQLLTGQPLALHCIQRLRDQSTGAPGLIAVNANRNPEVYGAWGCPVWPDAVEGFAGPLAGVLTALQHCIGVSNAPNRSTGEYRYVLTVACDTPRFPLDLLARLAQSLQDADADIAMAGALEVTPAGTPALRTQPVFCLIRTDLAESLQAYLGAGGRKVDTWTAQHRTVTVPFDQPQDDAMAFFNANTLAELERLEAAASESP